MAKIFISEFATIDALSPGSIALGKVSTCSPRIGVNITLKAFIGHLQPLCHKKSDVKESARCHLRKSLLGAIFMLLHSADASLTILTLDHESPNDTMDLAACSCWDPPFRPIHMQIPQCEHDQLQRSFHIALLRGGIPHPCNEEDGQSSCRVPCRRYRDLQKYVACAEIMGGMRLTRQNAVWYLADDSHRRRASMRNTKITSAQGNKDLRIKLAAVTGQSSRKSCISIRPACGRAHERMAARQRGSARAQRPNSNLKPLASPLPDGLRHLRVESRDVMRQRRGECDEQSGTLNRPIFTSKKTFEESLFIFRGPRILTNPDRG